MSAEICANMLAEVQTRALKRQTDRKSVGSWELKGRARAEVADAEFSNQKLRGQIGDLQNSSVRKGAASIRIQTALPGGVVARNRADTLRQPKKSQRRRRRNATPYRPWTTRDSKSYLVLVRARRALNARRSARRRARRLVSLGFS
jgi:hypothetical protein